MEFPFRVKAVYEYSSPHLDDLSFSYGQIITVNVEEDADWYAGEYFDSSGTKKEGLFPKNFVEKYEPEPPPRPVRTSRSKNAEQPTPVVEATSKLTGDASATVFEEPPHTTSVPDASKPIVEMRPSSDELGSRPTSVDRPVRTAQESAFPLPHSVASSKMPQLPIPPSTVLGPSSIDCEVNSPLGNANPRSFKERIAAFNNASATPIAPTKPGAAPSNLPRKPFVAPHSKDPYTTSPKVNRYEEDEASVPHKVINQENIEESVSMGSQTIVDTKECPKPTSLKERIALLQKQAVRRPEMGLKEKHKSSMTRSKSHEMQEIVDTVTDSEIQSRQQSGRDSVEASRPPPLPRAPPPRGVQHGPKSSRSMADGGMPTDGKDAEPSAIGEGPEVIEESSIRIEDGDDRSHNKMQPCEAPSMRGNNNITDDEDTEKNHEEQSEEVSEEESEEDIRRRELMKRMAKISGGMSMFGMLGGPGSVPVPSPMATKRVCRSTTEKMSTEVHSGPSLQHHQVPMIPMPGMAHISISPSEETDLGVGKEKEVTVNEERTAPPLQERIASPQSPQACYSQPLVSEVMPVPLSPAGCAQTSPVPQQSPSPGSESDDEMTSNNEQPPISTITDRESEHSSLGASPRVPGYETFPVPGMEVPQSAPWPRTSYRQSYSDQVSIASGPAPQAAEVRTSQIPPIPTTNRTIPLVTQGRPPPPPPSAAPSLPFNYTAKVNEDKGETDYEGDYDSDLTSGAAEKDVLGRHTRDYSRDSVESPTVAVSSSIPLFPPSLPCSPPPPPPQQPQQPPSNGRQTVSIRRVPQFPSRGSLPEANGKETYGYYAPSMRIPSGGQNVSHLPASPTMEYSDEEVANPVPATRKSIDRSVPAQGTAHDHVVSSSPFPNAVPHAPSQSSSPRSRIARNSVDFQMHTNSMVQISAEQPRLPADHSYIAADVDPGKLSMWWTKLSTPPPVFQQRLDVMFEIKESSTSKLSGKTLISKIVHVIFQDYSQTMLTARFDAQEPSEVMFEQRHKQPPTQLRKDQLEDAHASYGRRIAENMTTRNNSVVGDGTPHALIAELLRPLHGALFPVGVRSYGALVYTNLANASVQQYDEIRAGDIVSFRNARFHGKHGAIHAKYTMDVGNPDHVAVVVDWDGTKKKVRAWEQGRGSKKVKIESFKVGDLRSGEMRVWRVMGRSWIGWDGGS